MTGSARLAALTCLTALAACPSKAPEPQAQGPASAKAPATPDSSEPDEPSKPAAEQARPKAGAPDGVEAQPSGDDATQPDNNAANDGKSGWTALDPTKLRYVAAKGGAFQSNSSVERAGPRLVEITYPETDAQKEFTTKHEEHYEVVRLSKEQLGELGVTRPKAVWLFGPDGPCKAKVKEPYAVTQYEIAPVLERGFFLESCTDAFAPVAYVGSKPPSAVWHPATTVIDRIVDKPKTFEHPARAHLEKLALLDISETGGKSVVHVRIREAGPVTEFGVMHHWPHPEPCEERESGGVTSALWDHESPPTWLEAGDEYSEPELVGSLSVDGALAAVVYDESFQMFVQTEADYRKFITGDYHDEDTAYWGWSVLDGYCGP